MQDVQVVAAIIVKEWVKVVEILVAVEGIELVILVVANSLGKIVVAIIKKMVKLQLPNENLVSVRCTIFETFYL